MDSAQDIHSIARAGLGIRIHNLSRVFAGQVAALADVDLDVTPGEFMSILGPSGCGKSTLLRMIAGLDRPTRGRVIITGSDTSEPSSIAHFRSDIAYVFQDAHLLPWRNVRRNVELPLEFRRISARRRRDQAEQAIEQVGLSDAAGRYPAQLSGGMRMRVSLARALVTNPRLLLLDEPFAALDEITRQNLDEQLRELWLKRRMTVVFVTHSTAEAVYLADRAVVMSKRPGRIVLDRKIELPQRRTMSLRTEPEFSSQMRDVFQALRGEATA